MSDINQRLQQLERKLQYLTDRQEILDCIARHSRACDRFDSDLLASAFHEDGIDEHGAANVIAGHKYSEWADKMHAQGSIQNMHNLTTHYCEIDGDKAHAESYVIGLFFNIDGTTGRMLAGRYLDRLERRDGEWKIVLRRSTVEVGMVGDASFMNGDYFRKMGFLKGLRNKDDVCYQRPLSLDETPEGHRWPFPQA